MLFNLSNSVPKPEMFNFNYHSKFQKLTDFCNNNIPVFISGLLILKNFTFLAISFHGVPAVGRFKPEARASWGKC